MDAVTLEGVATFLGTLGDAFVVLVAVSVAGVFVSTILAIFRRS